MRMNAWVSLALFVAALAFFIWWQLLGGWKRRGHAHERKPEPPPTMAVPRGRVRPRR